ncbi:MAG: pilus assembly protein N-terminal domain-containing protein [Deltaproteobacteria bacterium]|nr:pilus assembly protein N-terminal domain-containing protein [Deltaproteobacteria bacterium]
MRNTCQTFLVIALVTGASPAVAQRTLLKLTVGESESVTVRGTITKVHVLNPAVADVVNYSTRQATIVGVSAGTTELFVQTARSRLKYQVVVTKIEVGRLFKRVRSFLGKIEGIYPRLFGDQIVISGYALTADDYGRAQHAVQLFGAKVLNMVRFKPSAIDQVNRIFSRAGLVSVHARLIGGSLFLEGAVGSADEAKKVSALLRAYGLQAENLVRIGGGKQILIDVQFVEMRKNNNNRIGVRWPGFVGIGSQGAPLQLEGTVPLQPAGPTQLKMNIAAQVQVDSAAVNMLFRSGYGRLLAQPKLVCGSGKEAEFLVGGEVPIVLLNNNVTSVTYKPYGIRLKVEPVADSLGGIQTKILAEVSEPDGTVNVQGAPGFRTRRFNTSVSVRDGKSIVLSGLFTNTDEKAVDKFPLLGHLPIVGELFKSREFRSNKTTLVVFVTPRVVSPEHRWVRETIKNIQSLYEDYKDEVGWQVFD